ncbi:hypothetical protein ACH0B5_10165 [Ureibacillus sp. 179-F W5.1 NHS]
MINKSLGFYIAFGGIVGLFFGGMWNGIGAMVLIYIAQQLEYIARNKKQ